MPDFNYPTAGPVLAMFNPKSGSDSSTTYTGSGTATDNSILRGIYNNTASTAPVGTYPAYNTAGADRSGTATTTSGALSVAANSSRSFLVGQNIGTNNIGFNEHGGTAAIGTAGTFTVTPGSSFSISTNKLVNFVASSGSIPISMTEG